MSDSYMQRLEDNAYMAVATLEKERYYEFTRDLMELIRQAKHYQQLAQSLCDTAAGVPYAVTEERITRARRDNDWY